MKLCVISLIKTIHWPQNATTSIAATTSNYNKTLIKNVKCKLIANLF